MSHSRASQVFKVDLHCHSFYSDGALSPQHLLERALAEEVKLLALTDHDTTAGSLELKDLARPHPIQIINGIELSVRWKCQDIHIIGLNIDVNNSALKHLLIKQNQKRTIRAKTIAALLEPTGIRDIYQKAADLAGPASIARPHFAQVLVNEGLVKDLQAAFKQYLARGRSAYVPTEWINIEEAVTGIVEAGGRAVIAHPLKYKLTRSKLQILILSFKEAGGTGLEVVSGDSTLPQIKELAGLCERYHLLASSGSDFHNDSYSYIKLGKQTLLPEICQPIWTGWL